jgi:hypothetical protein
MPPASCSRVMRDALTALSKRKPWRTCRCVGILNLLHTASRVLLFCVRTFHSLQSAESITHTQTDEAIFQSVSEFSTLLWEAIPLFHSAVRDPALFSVHCALRIVPRLAGQSDFYIGIFDSASSNNSRARGSVPYGLCICTSAFRILRPLSGFCFCFCGLEFCCQKSRHLTYTHLDFSFSFKDDTNSTKSDSSSPL